MDRQLNYQLILNQPNEYTGGELILNISPEKKSIKLQAGEMIVYPIYNVKLLLFYPIL